MAGQNVLEKRTTKDDINASKAGARVLKDAGYDLDEDTVQELDRKIDVISQPLVIGEYTLLCMLRTWKRSVTLTFRITVAIVLPSGVGRKEFSHELH